MRKHLPGLLLLAALAGCATYSSAERAAAIEQLYVAALAKIRPISHVGGVARFYNIDDDDYACKVVNTTDCTTVGVADYDRAQDFYYAALVKSAIFDQVVRDVNDGNHVHPRAGEAAIYLYAVNPNTVNWYFSNSAVSDVPLHFDSGKTDLADRTQYWLERIASAAATGK